MKKVIYLRVSKKEMDENTQLPIILNHYNLKKENCLILQERISGYKEEVQEQRTELKKLLNMIDNKEVKEIYVYSLERLYRNFNWLLELYFRCQKYEIEIYSHLQPEISMVKGITPTEKLMKLLPILLSGYVAEQESYLISERTKKSFVLNEFGDKVSYKGNKLGRKTDITDEDEKEILELIKTKSYRDIQKIFLHRNKKISIGTISKIINN